ncbi:MAG TPA: GTP-binding protein [Rectinemataceae bacterium]|nr:GTP-binding protein [Rectinemataceae bacterium]
MAPLQPRPLRNIGILAHIDAGKTSITERLLYISGRIRAPGAVDSGTTATDFLAVERERGITVKAAAAQLGWQRDGSDFRINLIDTPGHVDFSSEVERSLRALDGAVIVLCAVAGVQSRTETLYRACQRRGAPRIAFINKMDRRGASFGRTAEDLRRILDPGAFPVQLPWGEGDGFRGVIDLVEMVARDFTEVEASSEAGSSSDPAAGRPARARAPARCIPEELREPAARAREGLIAFLAEGSEGEESGLTDDYLSGREPESGSLRAALRRATLSGRLTPVFCGSAFSDGAAALLLDAVTDYLPAPEEARPPEGKDPVTGLPSQRRSDPESPLSAQVFKTSEDAHFGKISWSRIWSGTIKTGDRVLDARSGIPARVVKLFLIQADSIETVEEAAAGDIVAVALGPAASPRSAAARAASAPGPGLGATGATLCAIDAPILFEGIDFEEPVVSLAIEPKTRADSASVRAGVERLVDEDPSLRYREDSLTGRIELSGMGELHLEVAAERLARERGAHVRIGRPRVSFREVLARPARAREEFDRDIGGEQVRATVALKLSPAERRSGLAISMTEGLRIARQLLDALRRGAEAALSVGPGGGFPVDDVGILVEELVTADLSQASERAVEIAASLAVGKALREAGAIVMEPVMSVEIELPIELLGEAAAAIARRGGRVESVEEGGAGMQLVTGAAPLRSLFGFTGELRSATSGRASHSTKFLRYEPLPAGVSPAD